MSSPSTPITLIGLGSIEYHSKEKCSAKNFDGKRCEEFALQDSYCKIHYEAYIEDLTKKEMKKMKKIIEIKEEEERREKAKQNEIEQYKKIKEEFEQDYLMVCGNFNKIMSDGNIIKISNRAMSNIAKNKKISYLDEKGKKKEKNFLDMWLEDENRVDYDCVKFYPPEFKGEIADDKYYNLWNGFQIEKEYNKYLQEKFNVICEGKRKEWEKEIYEGKKTEEEVTEESKKIGEELKQSFEYSEKKIRTLIDPILQHIGFITGNQTDFFVKWLARIIQFPGVKTEVAIVIRDMGSLFVESGGIGKNLIVDFFGKKILGSRYFYTVSENKELYENFNTIYNGKLLVFVEEMGGKQNYENKDDLKSKITKKDISIQGKGDNRFVLPDFCNYLCTSNNEKLPIDKRRMSILDSITTKKGDVEYFENLTKEFDKFEVQYSFYLYLKNLNTWSSVAQIQDAIPNTKARNELIRASVPIFMKWMVHYSTLVFLQEKHTSTEIYDSFCNWYRITREGTEANILKQREFCNKLTKEDLIFHKTKNSNIYYEADIDYILENLKKQLLLPFDYKIEDAINEYTTYQENLKNPKF